MSPELLAAAALHAAVPGRALHILKDITLEDLQGQATRFGPFAGPGLSSLKSAMAWATGSSSNNDNDNGSSNGDGSDNDSNSISSVSSVSSDSNDSNDSNRVNTPAASNDATTSTARASNTPRTATQTKLATLQALGASADLFPLNRRQRSDDLQLFCTLLRNLALVREEHYGPQALLLHTALVHQCLVVRRGMSSRLPRPVFPVNRTIRSLATRNLLRLAGTLHVVEVGEGHNAAIVLFHAGVIKYNGDYVLRAVLHVLCGLSCLKFLLRCDHAGRATTAREAVIATQTASEAMGLEAVLAEWRTRAADRYGALVSLQNAPQRRRGLDVTDEELWAREVRRYRKSQQRHSTPRRQLDIVTAHDREAQITLNHGADGQYSAWSLSPGPH